MAVQSSAQWWVRTDGNNENGGGFDEDISGAGTNYSDQASHQLSLTDLATSGAGSTTVTSATGGFTSAMIGNAIRIRSGTNFTTGYYFITAHTDANTVTVDRSPTPGGAGSSGAGKLGGAWKDIFYNFASGGTGSRHSLNEQPQVGGNVLNVRSALNLAKPATTDADDYTHGTSYWILPNMTKEGGNIRIKGYNGRPKIGFAGLLVLNTYGYNCEYLYFEWSAANWASYGVSNTSYNCLFDCDGQAVAGVNGGAIHCEFRNSGSKTAVTTAQRGAINTTLYHNPCMFNYIHDWRGQGINGATSAMAAIHGNLIANVGDHALDIAGSSVTSFDMSCTRNSIYNPGGAGIRLGTNANQIMLIGNVIEEAGDYGIEYTGAADSDKMAQFAEIRYHYNAIYNSGTSDYSGLNKPSNDITLTASPFTDAANDDFSINNTAGGGAACRLEVNIGLVEDTDHSNHMDVGALRHEDPAGGGGGAPGHGNMTGGLQ